MNARVAIIVGTFPQWSERFIVREVTELLRRGIDFQLFALRRGALPFGSDPEFEPLLTRFQMLPRTLTATVMNIGRPPRGDAGARVKQEMGLGGVARSMKSRALVRNLRQGNFTHIHAHFANWPSTLGWLAAKETGLPFSFSAHARDLFVEPQLLEDKAEDATAFFACHARGYDRLRELHKGDRAVLMYHGLPLEQYPFVEPAAVPEDRPARLLCAGRFVPKKGQRDALEALTRPPLLGRNIELTLLGAGEGREELEQAIVDAGLQQSARLMKPESSTRLIERLRKTDLLLAPCRQAPDGDHDGVPNILLEAMALGVPVVATDAGSLSEVLTSNTGFVAPAGDVDALSEAIAEALDHPEQTRRRARAGRDLVAQRHTIRTAIEPLLSVLSS